MYIMDDLMNRALEYLKTDTFKNLSTLKYIALYKDELTLSLIEEAQGWALMVVIPTRILSYDTAVYPGYERAVFLNGTSERLKLRLLHQLVDSSYILRLNEELDISGLEGRFKIEKGNCFISYSYRTVHTFAGSSEIPGDTRISKEAFDIIKRNGYTDSDLKKYFDDGAAWFGLKMDGQIKSACFVYRNYEDIWEIAGVHTLDSERNKGYARIVVASALNHLLERKLIPRYEAEIRNTNSLKLARSLGMTEFLRIDHFLLDYGSNYHIFKQ